MEKIKTDAEIIKRVMKELNIETASSFARSLGYKNGSHILGIINGDPTRLFSDKMKFKIMDAHPSINSIFLNYGQEPVTIDKHKAIGQANLNIDNNTLQNILVELKDTNKLLREVVKQIKKQG